MKAKRPTNSLPADPEKLLELARKAPTPQRSKLTPYLGVVFELRNREFSYEKIADFLNEHTGLEFTRSQVFAFVQRNSSLFGAFEAKIADEESEPLPVQLVWDHSKGLAEAIGGRMGFNATFISAPQVKDNSAPEKFGVVDGIFYAHYRLRMEGEGPIPEWWHGGKWERITADSVRHVWEPAKEILESLKRGRKGGRHERSD